MIASEIAELTCGINDLSYVYLHIGDYKFEDHEVVKIMQQGLSSNETTF
ncbi:hypothetical protein I8748_18700 [Nostoc sp. CENA67]|uniref:Uncharacterized protein n=1 Tax=Amazonocrinis nigriterrae CENA67 TaxID=2794033 RepID=A0A8J7HR76_9NOST|nr:hypothetical protein [Amazonocrinis nigriterrae]MBH8564192.1 hypothetical protein [Amazonocrinis nigriterrae CENA67]